MEIRQEQMDVLAEAARRDFENQLVLHVQEFSPRSFEILGEPVVREVVQAGMARAEEYGFTNRGPVQFYIELMFMFGSDYDTDPQYPWAHEILSDADGDQMVRADRLYEESMDFVQKVAGPDFEYEKRALRRVRRLDPDLPSKSGAGQRVNIRERLRRMHPEKYDYIGKEAIRALIERGSKLAGEHSITEASGGALLVALMFAFGHGCVTDPQFPWIAETLKESSDKEAGERVQLLYSKMMTYFDHALEAFKEGA